MVIPSGAEAAKRAERSRGIPCPSRAIWPQKLVIISFAGRSNLPRGSSTARRAAFARRGAPLPMNPPNRRHPERSEGSFATGAQSKDPVSFTRDVPLQFHGILRLRYARLSTSAPLRMTAIWEVHPTPKITPACYVPRNDPRKNFRMRSIPTTIAVGDESSSNPRIGINASKAAAQQGVRLTSCDAMRLFPFGRPVRGFLADSSPTATVVLALRA